MADQIRDRGETPFLHTGAANIRAINLYLALGYELRREVEFVALRSPDRRQNDTGSAPDVE